MSTPRKNAEEFVRIWRLETPADIATFYNELHGTPPEVGLEVERKIKEVMQQSGIKIYGGLTEKIRRRGESEYSKRVLQRLGEVLQNAYVTEPCKEFLHRYVETNLRFGTPPEQLMPLEWFGINIEKESYGIFDPNRDTRGIERKLLEYHDKIIKGLTFPGLRRKESELHRRWRQAYNQRQQTPELTP